MITRIAGTLETVESGRAVLATGPMAIEVLVPAGEVPRLALAAGGPVVLHTMVLLESQSQGSSFTPRLLGFASERDRAFFELFTTVKGIGPRKALRALARPTGEVAAAIASEDVAALTALPEIGKRTAQTIVAELAGKVDPWVDPAALDAPAGAGAGATGGSAPAAPVRPATAGELPAPALDALRILVDSLGEAPARASVLVETVMRDEPELADPAAIIEAAYRSPETAGG